MLMEGRVYDISNNANHGTIKGEASLDENGKFGKCLHLQKNSNVSLGSQTFHNRPSSAITIALWIKLMSTEGRHEMFHTCSSDTPNGRGQYHFEVNDGNVRWFHRDHMGRTVFNVESGEEKYLARIRNSLTYSRRHNFYCFTLTNTRQFHS